MVFMIPPQVLKYNVNKNVNDVKATHLHFVHARSMDQVVGFTWDNVLGLIIDKSGYDIQLSSVSFDGQITIDDPELQKIVDDLRKNFRDGQIIESEAEDTGQSIGKTIEEFSAMIKEKSQPIIQDIQDKLDLTWDLKDTSLRRK